MIIPISPRSRNLKMVLKVDTGTTVINARLRHRSAKGSTQIPLRCGSFIRDTQDPDMIFRSEFTDMETV